MDPTSARERIIAWQNKIRDYVSNDTGEDMEIKDKPADWGKIGDYRLTSTNNNYFTVKAQTINDLK